jgi:hypothetical protein
MNVVAKPQSLVGALPAVDEVSAAALFEAVGSAKDRPLVFHYEDRDVKPSYHVTEVKTGSFRGLDCGANTERWNETFIQLWDIEEEHRGHMPGWKFLAIIGKVREAVGFDDDAKLTFEVSDGVNPMQLYRAERIERGDVTRVYLSPRPSSCKPRDRWLQAEQAKESSCCTPKAAKPCCG